MTYTFNDQAIFEAVAGAKAIVRRPIGMSDKKWAKYADGVVKALDNRAPCTPLERGEAIHKSMLDDAQKSPSMKLVDILARELKVWPHSDDASASQDPDKEIAFFEHSDQSITTGYQSWSGNSYISRSLIALKDLASDWKTAKVTRAEWQAAVDALNAPKDDAQTDDTVSVRQFIGRGWRIPVYNIDEIGIINWPRRVYSFDLPPSLRDLDVKPKAEPKPVEWDGKGLPPVGSEVLTMIDFKKAPPYTIINLTEMGVDVQRAKPRFQKAKVLYASDKYVITMTSSGVECMAPRSCVKFERIQDSEQVAAEAPEPKTDSQENKEFLEARVKLLEDEEQSRKARIKDLESQLEQLTADNEALSDIVVQLDDNAIQVLMRARDGDGLYFTSKEGQKVSVLRSGD